MGESRQDWSADRIKRAIYDTGISMQAAALDAGLEAATVRKALRMRCPAGERVIAKLLGVRLHEIWPSRYDTSDKAHSRPYKRRHPTYLSGAAHRQIGGAA